MVKILLPGQQHQSLLQWINSWATTHYGFDTMKNALMLTTDNRRMGDSLKAKRRDKCTTGLLKVRAIDSRMPADEIIYFISKKMTLQHRKEAQHQDRGGERSWQLKDFWQMAADVTETATPVKQDMPKGSGGASDASGGNLRVRTLSLECRRWTPSWRKCTGCSPQGMRMQAEGAAPLRYAAAVIPRVPREARQTRQQGQLICLLRAESRSPP